MREIARRRRRGTRQEMFQPSRCTQRAHAAALAGCQLRRPSIFRRMRGKTAFHRAISGLGREAAEGRATQDLDGLAPSRAAHGSQSASCLARPRRDIAVPPRRDCRGRGLPDRCSRPACGVVTRKPAAPRERPLLPPRRPPRSRARGPGSRRGKAAPAAVRGRSGAGGRSGGKPPRPVGTPCRPLPLSRTCRQADARNEEQEDHDGDPAHALEHQQRHRPRGRTGSLRQIAEQQKATAEEEGRQHHQAEHRWEVRQRPDGDEADGQTTNPSRQAASPQTRNRAAGAPPTLGECQEGPPAGGRLVPILTAKASSSDSLSPASAWGRGAG